MSSKIIVHGRFLEPLIGIVIDPSIDFLWEFLDFDYLLNASSWKALVKWLFSYDSCELDILCTHANGFLYAPYKSGHYVDRYIHPCIKLSWPND